MLDLLTSKDVQQLAWRRHGFRTVDYSGSDPISRFGVNGVIDQVTNVAELPDNQAMQAPIAALE